MSQRIAWIEGAALATALVVVEIIALILELRTSIITDWFVSIAPLIWLNVSVFFAYALMRQLQLSREERVERKDSRWGRGLMEPDFFPLRRLIRKGRFSYLWLTFGLAYAITYMFLQGMVIVDLSGNLYPQLTFLESPVGYGPAIAWTPSSNMALILRPYSTAAAAALAIFSGLVLALFTVVVRLKGWRIGALPGPVSGMLVFCPACLATPATGLLIAYIAPAASLVGLGTAYTYTTNLAISTALLLMSLALLWVTTAWLARTVPRD